MPRISQSLRDSVFFLYGKNPESGAIDITAPQGAGVLIGTGGFGGCSEEIMHVYAISAAHVAVRGASIIRVNTVGGQSRLIEIEPEEWHWIAGGSDIAAVDVTDRIDLWNDNFSCIPLYLFAGRHFIEEAEIGPGDDGFMLGLFTGHCGEKRNLVAARFGNISLVAEDDAPVEQPNGTKRPCHIFDIRSRPGFSGAPVFVYRTPDADLREMDRGSRIVRVADGGNPTQMESFQEKKEGRVECDLDNNMFLLLLGIHIGQYPENIVLRKTQSKSKTPSLYADGEKLEVPSSMTVVAPVDDIMELLDLEALLTQREERERAEFSILRNKAE